MDKRPARPSVSASDRRRDLSSRSEEANMPEEEVVERARKDQEQGKSPSTQAGEFVREEMHHIREGKHGARSPQQAIAIGLSKARRAGVKLPPPNPGKTAARTRAPRRPKRPRFTTIENIENALKSNLVRAQARRTLRGLAGESFASSAPCGAETWHSVPPSGSDEGVPACVKRVARPHAREQGI